MVYDFSVSIADNISAVQARIAGAAARARRNPAEISLMAVTKTQSPELIRQAYDAGLRLFGENRVQEFQAKAETLRDLKNAEWRMIGHLQSNKAARAAELFSAIDSVDSLRLAEKLNSAAADLGKKLSVLIEINLGGESAKTGLAAESNDLQQLLSAAAHLPNLEFRGFMTVPPLVEDPQLARPFFKTLRELRDQIAARGFPGISTQILSMGMSHDFEVAIEEGSTCVRVGAAIFGERNKL